MILSFSSRYWALSVRLELERSDEASQTFPHVWHITQAVAPEVDSFFSSCADDPKMEHSTCCQHINAENRLQEKKRKRWVSEVSQETAKAFRTAKISHHCGCGAELPEALASFFAALCGVKLV
jgi:hypothetical protein